MTSTRFAPSPVFDQIEVGRLRVLIDQASGEVASVQDALTGCAASLMYSRAQIAQATQFAQSAWASTADLS